MRKASVAIAETMRDLDPVSLDKFTRELAKALSKEPSLNLFGCYNGPDAYVRGALRKAKLEDSAVTDVIIIALESNDRIKVYRDGNWTER
jgi:hypothetical protein